MSDDNPFAVSDGSYGDRSRGPVGDGGVSVSRRTIEILEQTRPWVRLIGVLCWIGVVVLGIAVAVMIVGALTGGAPEMFLMALLYVVMLVIYIYVAKSLTGYAGKIGDLAETENVHDLEGALEHQKTFWRIVGIATAAYLVIVILFVAFGVALGGIAAMQ